MTIIVPCIPGRGFSTLPPAHEYKPVRNGLLDPQFVVAPPRTCPNCDMLGHYNANLTRIIMERGQGGGLGNGYTMTDGYGNTLPWGQYNGVPMYVPIQVVGWGVVPVMYQGATAVHCCIM